jgi:hypothetical protein
MKTAIIGSRTLTIHNLEKYLPSETTEIISGGAKGIDLCAKNFAISNGIKFTEFLPNYSKYGRIAPIKRNLKIINSCDIVLAFWDGKSKGTEFVIKSCKKAGLPICVFLKNNL